MITLQLGDQSGAHSVTFRLEPRHIERKAIDVVFEVIGADPEYLIENRIIDPDGVDSLKALQMLIFDEDAEGKFIRQNVKITANGHDINPDKALRDAFPTTSTGQLGVCQLTVELVGAPGDLAGKMQQYARMFFLHQILDGKPLDVTVDHLDLQPLIDWAEKEAFIEIDVKRAAYKLTEKGKRLQQKQLDEAQDLIRRYDIYGDVDVDSSGTVRFDTGLGRDVRVPVFELEGVDPFRSRFLLGLNDGEWKDSDWPTLATNESWYDEVFSPIESAPSIEEIGETQLRGIIEQGKKAIRLDRANQQHHSFHDA